MKKRDNNTNKPEGSKLILPSGHKKLVTRRDFLSHGLTAGAGWAMAPSVLTLLSSRVMAEDLACPAQVASTMIPFIGVDLAGGAALGEDFTVGENYDQMNFMSDYTNWGLDNASATSSYAAGLPPDFTFGVAMHPASAFLAGLKATITDPVIRSKIDGAIIPCLSNDDSDQNTLSPIHYLPIIGRTGVVKNIIGTSGGQAGGRHLPAVGSYKAENSPTLVNSRNTARAVGGAGELFNFLSPDRAERVLRGISRLSSSKLAEFSNLSLDNQIRVLVQCNYLDASSLPGRFLPDSVFPADNATGADADLIAVFAPGGATATTVNNAAITDNSSASTNGPEAAIARLVLSGPTATSSYVGAGVIEKGNYDNHDGTNANPYGQRLRAGMAVGRLISYAARKSKPVFIFVSTDGAMGITGTPTAITVNVGGQAATANTYARPGDGGQFSVQAMLVYHPNATPRDGNSASSIVSNRGRQIGSGGTGGAVQQGPGSLLTASDRTTVAKAVAYNYLALHKEGRELDDAMKTVNGNSQNPFAGVDEGKYRIFKKV